MYWSLLPSRYHLKYNNSFLKNEVIFWSVALQVSTCKTLLLQVTSAHQIRAQKFATDASAHPLTGILNLLTTRHFCPSWLINLKTCFSNSYVTLLWIPEFLTHFSMFKYEVKHSLSCSIYYFSVFGYQTKRSFSCLIYNLKHFFSRLIKIKNWPCWFPQRCDCDCSA